MLYGINHELCLFYAQIYRNEQHENIVFDRFHLNVWGEYRVIDNNDIRIIIIKLIIIITGIHISA